MAFSPFSITRDLPPGKKEEPLQQRTKYQKQNVGATYELESVILVEILIFSVKLELRCSKTLPCS
jgi:hypothetical protein